MTEPEPSPPDGLADPAPTSGAPSTQALVLEVLAVLAVSVLPWLGGAVVVFAQEPARNPYWVDAFHLTWQNFCVIFVVLYLIHRSGEGWETFGLVRPQFGDVGIALALMLAEALLWYRLASVLPDDSGTNFGQWTRPQTSFDMALMVGQFLVGAFCEELVLRAYLITRLERLLESRLQAVLLSAVAFASYHIYQGTGGILIYHCCFGLFFGGFYVLVRRLWPFALAHALINILLTLQRVG